MKKAVVITSIFHPTEAIKRFAEIKDIDLIIVGDLKSPEDWNYKGANFISIKQQKESGFELAKTLPYNHYSRKMLGYLNALLDGADYIIDTDDDNIPKSNWTFPAFEGQFECTANNLGFVNIYQYFTDQKIWPRGLPLNLIGNNYNIDDSLESKNCKLGVWQGLADEDPDVDAIYRLTIDEPCYFKDREPIVLSKGTVSPFNTQNTMIRKELFPLLYLPTYVTFRFTDILRGLVAQPIMWLYDYHLGFLSATVIQKRNEHDYYKDFLSEIPMYENCSRIIDIVSDSITKNLSIGCNLFNCYEKLQKEKVVSSDELKVLTLWLNDLEKIKIV